MKLIEIDLSRTCEKPDSDACGKCWHPDIDLDRHYLAEIQFTTDEKASYHAGRFSEVWFGLSFHQDPVLRNRTTGGFGAHAGRRG